MRVLPLALLRRELGSRSMSGSPCLIGILEAVSRLRKLVFPPVGEPVKLTADQST
jgi:hypothetical protein